MAAAVVVALGALAAMIGLVVHIRAGENGTGRLGFASTSAAAAPFTEFSEARVSLGERCLRVLVAASPAQRVQGLRDVTSLGPYAGMLFVTRTDVQDHFTMAQTPMPLAITFFSSSGAPVDTAQMVPCPHGSDASCPEYVSKSRYRYALERPAGSAPASGTLGGCSA